MFLDKFRNRYSFNFLSICGWIIFLLLCAFLIPFISAMFSPYSGFPGIAFAFLFLLILALNIIFYLLTFFIYVFEIISWKRITNEKFLNNKYTKIFQTLGIIFAFLPIIILAIFYTYSFLQDGIYKILGID